MSTSERKPSSFYRWNRRLHLYLGIAVSPILLVFAVSTLFLNHGVKPSPSESKETISLVISEGLEGKELVANVLDQLQLSGEVIGNGQIGMAEQPFAWLDRAAPSLSTWTSQIARPR